MLALKRAFGYDSPIPSVAVIGAGIGGLRAALSLLQARFDVHVYGRAAAVEWIYGHDASRIDAPAAR